MLDNGILNRVLPEVKVHRSLGADYDLHYKRRSKELLWYCVRYSVLFCSKKKGKILTIIVKEVPSSTGSSISRLKNRAKNAVPTVGTAIIH